MHFSSYSKFILYTKISTKYASFGIGWVYGWGTLASVFSAINIAIGAICLAIAYFKPHLKVPYGSVFKSGKNPDRNSTPVTNNANPTPAPGNSIPF